ncbi:hypothetical protein [Mucilaginibacter sp. UR6-11]|uniref:hypothetical protein n=1 Tax=Mucilaginibacter sp. UR6-11 TaxID=1435644 RepID=UPI001E526F90|nr:hypothetical protein [Mucilaginibacter sp. UR6-11]MCC8425643.1 hypothetical protein [Mucilaginibacter sp. UR6-11]
MKRIILTTTLMLCAALICFAAITDLTGKWKGAILMADGNEIPLTYTFKVDGEKLTGTVLTPQDQLTIYDGKITSDKDFSFKVDVNGDAVLSTGKFYGDSVIVVANLAGDKLRSKLKRVVDK